MNPEWERIQKEWCDKCVRDVDEDIMPPFECLVCNKLNPENKTSYFIPKETNNE